MQVAHIKTLFQLIRFFAWTLKSRQALPSPSPLGRIIKITAQMAYIPALVRLLFTSFLSGLPAGSAVATMQIITVIM